MNSTDQLDSSDGGLFAGTAWHYARYRPGYPREFLDDMIERLGLRGTGRLLDLGCGTGQLTLPLAAHVAEAVGMDPEPEMLTEASRQARERDVTNVTWTQGTSAELPGDLGHFRLVTMGRSFHWMDREQVLTALDEMVDDGGGLVIANDSCLIRPTTTWQQAIEEVQRSFLPPEHQHGPTPTADPRKTHDQVLANSPFCQVNRKVYEFLRPWTIEQAIGYLYSTSLPLRQMLGDQQGAFEDAVTDTLLAIDPIGHFTEPVALEVLTASRN
ncbi:class I SAM-dependent methyltransferase [Nocardia abscessus]|uniref:class I SAM-dependent methyltransferase n=1 Tax=Nocardia abscessus TaxID=120957 RepID=UPI0024537519|nr:class I SAM-dependent methyltransferase [Nocardia abscessus]